MCIFEELDVNEFHPLHRMHAINDEARTGSAITNVVCRGDTDNGITFSSRFTVVYVKLE